MPEFFIFPMGTSVFGYQRWALLVISNDFDGGMSGIQINMANNSDQRMLRLVSSKFKTDENLSKI